LLEKALYPPDAPVKIVWLLEHQYSPEGLSLTGLKSADAARAKVLAQAAERADCAAHLGIVHIEEWGPAESTYYPYRPRHLNRYDQVDEEEEWETQEADSEDFEVVEVCDSWHYVSECRDLRDQTVDFGKLPLAPGELLP